MLVGVILLPDGPVIVRCEIGSILSQINAFRRFWRDDAFSVPRSDIALTTYGVLALLSNQYCVSLLNEVQLAIIEAAWPTAETRLQEFTANLVCYRAAGEELLYPRLIEGALLGRARLNRLRRQQNEIERRRRRVAVGVSQQQTETCCVELRALIAILAAYGRSERRLFTKLPPDEALLKSFAARLHRSLPAGDLAPVADSTQRKPNA
ncbi:hypothetical protein SAHY_01912 [Salinisphaera hydrothermalis EPR70]